MLMSFATDYCLVPLNSEALQFLFSTMTLPAIRVFEAEKPSPNDAQKPAHWVDDKGTSFKNPWASWREHDWRDQLYVDTISFVDIIPPADDAIQTDCVWALQELPDAS